MDHAAVECGSRELGMDRVGCARSVHGSLCRGCEQVTSPHQRVTHAHATHAQHAYLPPRMSALTRWVRGRRPAESEVAPKRVRGGRMDLAARR